MAFELLTTAFEQQSGSFWLGVVINLILFIVACISFYVYYFNKKPVSTSGLSLQYQSLKLIKKTSYNHNTVIFRFELPNKNDKMGLSIGSHVMLTFKQNKSDEYNISRPYTPITNDFDSNNLGHFDLMIKIYENGKMSQYLNKLPIGQTVKI